MKNRGTIAFAAFVAIAGLIYIFARFTGAASKIVLVNGSGRAVDAVTLVSGDQRIDIGTIGNGASKKVDLAPGKPLQIEYVFESVRAGFSRPAEAGPTRRVWVSPEPLAPLQALTIFIGADQKLRLSQRPDER